MNESIKHLTCEVVVVGAGPYGLAVAAHLGASKVETLIFGEAMSFWQQHMPKGMKLRSPWQATHLADPDRSWSMDAYDAARKMKRSDPVPVEQFVAYGQWFQRNAVPDLDPRKVAAIDEAGGSFALRLDDGATIATRRVVVALGLANQEYRPAEFANLPVALVSHACEHNDLSSFKGLHVAVVGRGQSATESAALLSEAGAEVELITRGPVNWLGIGGKQPNAVKRVLREALTPPSAVGPFPFNWLAEFPGLVHRLPVEARRNYNERTLRAGAAGWLLPRFGKVKINPGRTILGAGTAGNGVALHLDNGTATFDHVLLATGYRIDIARFGVLSADLLARIIRMDGSPVLSVGLETNVPGLHFVGASAVASFGPLMRFIAGSAYAARAVTRAATKSRATAPRLGVARATRNAAGQIGQLDVQQ
jgi:cation diffusion facilitator CzcD-associated flavoprotein CzcO